jgi:hypothetical protein
VGAANRVVFAMRVFGARTPKAKRLHFMLLLFLLIDELIRQPFINIFLPFTTIFKGNYYDHTHEKRVHAGPGKGRA